MEQIAKSDLPHLVIAFYKQLVLVATSVLTKVSLFIVCGYAY